jgi:hypothetical protein
VYNLGAHIYVNGSLAGSTPAAQPGLVTASTHYVGANSVSQYQCTGKIWGVRFYSIALTGAEIKALYLFELGGGLA